MKCAETLVGVHVFNERLFKACFDEHTQRWSYTTEIACVCGERPEDPAAERKRISEVERLGARKLASMDERLPGFE